MTAKHTPKLRKIISPDPDAPIRFGDDEGRIIAELSFINGDEHEVANSIVRAVNSHDALLDAARAALSEVQACRLTLEAIATGNQDAMRLASLRLQDAAHGVMGCAEDQIRAAIAAATGEGVES